MLKRNSSSSDFFDNSTPDDITSELQRVRSSSSLYYGSDSLSPVAASFNAAPAISALTANTTNVSELKQRLTEALDHIERLRADIRTERLARNSLKRSHESKMSGLYEKVKSLDSSTSADSEIARLKSEGMSQINRMRSQISRLEEENRSLQDELQKSRAISESSLMELDSRMNDIERRAVEDANKKIKAATAAASTSVESERQRLATLAQYAKDNEELLLARLESEHLHTAQLQDLLAATAKDLEFARRHNEQLTSEHSALIYKSQSLESSVHQLEHLVKTERDVNKNISRISKIDSLRRAEDKLRRVMIIKRDRACLHRFFMSWRVQAARYTVAQSTNEQFVFSKNAAAHAMLKVVDTANAEKASLLLNIEKISKEKNDLEAKFVKELNNVKSESSIKLEAASKSSADTFRERLAYAKDEAENIVRQVRADSKAEIERVKETLQGLLTDALKERDDAIKAQDRRYRDLGLQAQKDKDEASLVVNATLARMKRDSDQQYAKFEALEKERKQALMRKVIGRATNRLIASGFSTWYVVAAEEKRREQLLNRAIRRMTQQRLSRAFARWTDCTSESLRLKSILRKVIRRALNSKVSAAFSTWHKNVRAEKHMSDVQRLRAEIDARELARKSALMRKVICRAMNARIASGFSAWRDIVAEEKRREQLLNRALRKMLQQRLSRAFGRWTSFAAESKRMKSLLSRSAATFRLSRAKIALSQWRSRIIEAREAKAKQEQTERIMRKALLRMQQIRLAGVFSRWQTNVSTIRHQRSICRRVILRALNSRLSAGFLGWRHQTAALIAESIKRANELERAQLKESYELELKRLRAEIDARELARKSALMRKVICRAMNARIASGFSAWRDIVAEEKRREQLLNRALRKMLQQRLSRAFGRWTSFAAESKRMKSLLSRSAATFRLSRAKIALSQWRYRIIEAREAKAKQEQTERIMRKALLRMQQIRLAGVFSRWQTNVSTIRHQRSICRRVILRALNSRLSAGFLGWRHQTAALIAESIKRANELERAQLKESYELELKRLRAEIDARELARKSALMRKVICRAMNARIASGFSAWRDIVAEEKRREQLLNRALRKMLQQRLSRAFGRWTSFAAESKRMKSLLSRSAATFRLSRAKIALSQWRYRIIEAREAKAKQEQTERIMRKALLRMQQIRLAGVFSRWQTNVSTIRHQRSICRRVILRALNSRLSAGFLGWRHQTAALIAESIKRANELERAQLKESYELELKRLRAEIDARELARKSALMRKVICRAMNARIASGFSAWRDIVAEEKRREQLLNRALRKMLQQRLSRAFGRWTDWKTESIRTKSLMRKVISRALNSKVSAAFSTWYKNVKAGKHMSDVQRLRAEIHARELARKSALMRKAIGRATNRLIASGFSTWYMVAAEEKRREQLLNRALRKMLQQRLSRAFAQWTSFATELIRMKSLMRKVIRRALNSKVSAAFSTWHKNVRAEKHMSDVQRLRAEIDARELARKSALMRKVIGHATNRLIASGFSTWYMVAAEEKRREQLLNRAIRRMTQQRLSRAFATWAELWSSAKSARLKSAHLSEFQLKKATLDNMMQRVLTEKEQEKKEHEAVLLLFREKERVLRDTFAEREQKLKESLANLESQLATERQLRLLSEDFARREADRFSEEMRQVAFREPVINSSTASFSRPLISSPTPGRVVLSPRSKSTRVSDGVDTVKQVFMF
jgi:polyisoprenoid-binding protein YceI